MRRGDHRKAFTIVELLTVVVIVSLLLAILVPSLSKAKRAVRAVVSAANQRQILQATALYAADHNDGFPESVATVGISTRWSWREPMVLTGFQKRSPYHYRSVGAYLAGYVDTGKTMFCPSAPRAYPYGEDAWLAGEAWDNPSPDTGLQDPVYGTYCLYWNYRGYLVESGRAFVGPMTAGDGREQSRLMITDYFGYGYWRNELTYGTRNAYASCENFEGASVTTGTAVSCDYWSKPADLELAEPQSISVRLRAGYTDGHVESYGPADVTGLKVSITPDGLTPYPDDLGPGGTIYLPRQAARH